MVSVIIMTFNSEKYIEQTLDSIINQKTAFSYEIVISDDCSNDNTRIILKEFQIKYNKIKLLFNESNLGIIANFKHVIDHCCAKYIAYCGHDDYWHDQTKLQRQIEFMEANPDFGLVHTDYNRLDERTGFVTKNVNHTKNISIKQGNVVDDVIYNYNIVSSTTCFRRDVFSKNVPIGEFVKLKFPVTDWATHVVIAKYSKIGYINTSTTTLRTGYESAGNPSDLKKVRLYLDGHKRMFNYLRDKFPGEFIRFGNNDFRIYKLFRLLGNAYKIRDFFHANEYSLKLKKEKQKSLKIFFAGNWFLFRCYLIIKDLYNMVVKFRKIHFH